MSKKRAVDLVETFGDFWLGMAGAAAKGFATVTERRRERKADKEQFEDNGFFKDVAEGLEDAVNEAQKVVQQVGVELRDDGEEGGGRKQTGFDHRTVSGE